MPVTIIVFIISFISFMTWIYHAALNARALGAKDMPIPPLRAALWKLIPIINLWIPFAALRDIWKASINPKNWRDAKIQAVFYVYWISSILYFTAIAIITMIIFNIDEFVSYLPIMVIIQLILMNISFLTSVQVAKAITRAQADMHRTVAFD
ncbi:DUF4328 domain-containing protein [Sulfitobacter sp. 1151]|uniref:DUF4328 domain-containing protein n=2 Tax=Parasulfitobacter algicola TaxID=2614809 RepID=A0ABX2IXS4_9RHOB|nr:DUF4328 domain-containing protein [Sulfitobacter algicola]NSX55329.1 DUF4328 domain-containing protein [Sulfitobacter algicola]